MKINELLQTLGYQVKIDDEGFEDYTKVFTNGVESFLSSTGIHVLKEENGKLISITNEIPEKYQLVCFNIDYATESEIIAFDKYLENL